MISSIISNPIGILSEVFFRDFFRCSSKNYFKNCSNEVFIGNIKFIKASLQGFLHRYHDKITTKTTSSFFKNSSRDSCIISFNVSAEIPPGIPAEIHTEIPSGISLRSAHICVVSEIPIGIHMDFFHFKKFNQQLLQRNVQK